MPSSRDQNFKTDRQTMAESTRADDKVSHPRLIVVSGVLLGTQIELGEEPVTIGRSGDCTLAIPHPSVSRQHCRVWREDGRYLIEDMGSTNRTYLNGKPVARTELRDGDQIGVGNNAIKYFIGASMEAEYHRDLIDLAIYDSLTGFYNRRHFRALLDEETEKIANAESAGSICLLMIDLDHFKAVNDRYGHMIGDQVLGGVAHVLREHSPADAAIGRLGGEEFAVALLGSTFAEAVELAEALRAAVAATPLETREGRVAATVSIGVSGTGGGVHGAADLLRSADVRLYRAKQAGRNHVCSTD
ncbi:MAG: GGDEF domain-containing protein [Proteobacteria bacterium]|nr:GGDEF domain-containing protein [Pseudomonadota bacterium]